MNVKGVYMIEVTVSTQSKKGYIYAVLYYKDINNEKKYVWRSTQVKDIKGNKKQAKKKAEEIRNAF